MEDAEKKKKTMEAEVQGWDRLVKALEAQNAKLDEEKRILLVKIQSMTDRFQSLDLQFAKFQELHAKSEKEKEIFRQDKIQLEGQLKDARTKLGEAQKRLDQLKDDSIHWEEERVALVQMVSDEGPRAVQEYRTSQLYDEERYDAYIAGRDFAVRVMQQITPTFNVEEFDRIAFEVAARERAAAENEVTGATEVAPAPEAGPEAESREPAQEGDDQP